MSEHPDLGASPVTLVRLPDTTDPDAFERVLRARAPAASGSLLTWLHGDWFAVPAAAAERLAAVDPDPRRLFETAGAGAGHRTTAAALIEMLATRELRDDASGHVLRDLEPGPVSVEKPAFTASGFYMGKPVLLDWHLDAIGVPAAWELLAGKNQQLPWDTVRVGHIDTGYTEHPAFGWGSAKGSWLRTDLGKNYLKDKAFAPSGDVTVPAWSSRPEHSGPRDNMSGGFAGHGTRTASMITGIYLPEEGTVEVPFFGVAAGVPLLPYRITDSVFIDHVPDLLAFAIRDAVDQQCNVISISLGAVRPSRRVAEAIDYAYERGVIVCAAAGNVISEVIYPGRFNRVVTVGGVTTSDGTTLREWGGGSRGKYVDVSGPADAIRRASTVLRRGREEYSVSGPGNGTSFATALCAGVAVLWLAYRRLELDAAYGTAHWARAAAFKRLLKETAIKPHAGWDTQNYGSGVYRAERLLQAPLPPLQGLHREAPAYDPFDPKA